MSGKVFTAFAIAGALLAVALAGRLAMTSGPPPPKGDLSVSLEDLDGKPFDLASLSGKPLVINLWATWCGPCRVETPQLVALADKYRARGLSIIGLSVD